MELQRSKQLVEKHRETILEVERYLWRHPETGFREWNTSAYLAKIFEEAGYELTMAGNIPGFYTDLDTGRPGPKILILGELDCLLQPNHPEAVDGKAHACGQLQRLVQRCTGACAEGCALLRGALYAVDGDQRCNVLQQLLLIFRNVCVNFLIQCLIHVL